MLKALLKSSIQLFVLLSTLAPCASAGLRPERIDDILGLETAWDGPNCWASSLYLLGLKDTWIYTGPREFAQTRDASCTPTQEHDLREGDLVVMQALFSPTITQWQEFHAFIHMEEGGALSKPNYMASRTLQWATLEEARLEREPAQPFRVRSLYFRCGETNNFRSSLNPAAVAAASEIEVLFSRMVLDPSLRLSIEDQTLWVDRIVALYQWSSQQPEFMAVIESIAYQWTALQYRARNGTAVP